VYLLYIVLAWFLVNITCATDKVCFLRAIWVNTRLKLLCKSDKYWQIDQCSQLHFRSGLFPRPQNIAHSSSWSSYLCSDGGHLSMRSYLGTCILEYLRNGLSCSLSTVSIRSSYILRQERSKYSGVYPTCSAYMVEAHRLWRMLTAWSSLVSPGNHSLITASDTIICCCLLWFEVGKHEIKGVIELYDPEMTPYLRLFFAYENYILWKSHSCQAQDYNKLYQ